METSILKKILSIDTSKIEDKTGQISLFSDYPNKVEITNINDLRLLQIVLARKTIIDKSNYLGELIEKGKYTKPPRDNSNWAIYKLNDNPKSNSIAVHWNEFDDDSWSVFYKEDNLDLDFVVYEN